MTQAFRYKDGELYAEGCSVAALAEIYPTPFYLYAAAAMTENYRNLATALAEIGAPCEIFYALKANSNQAVISLLARKGSGADVVSQGEIMRAIAAGISPQKIVFSGVGKSQTEIEYALDNDILQFNVESESEMHLLNNIAARKQKIANIALRINPDVDAMTHAKISTGKSENKFGIPIRQAIELYKTAEKMKALSPTAIAVHIGSQLQELTPYRQAWEKIFSLVQKLAELGIRIQNIDLGGGIGLTPNHELAINPKDYAKLIKEIFSPLCEPISQNRNTLRFMFEPGRAITGNSGILVTRILHAKQGTSKQFIIIDAAMNDLIRPTLYDGVHAINPVKQPAKNAKTITCDVVGPICESGDFLAKNIQLPNDLNAGDILYIADTGAYGAVMSNTYNSRPLIAEIMVCGSQAETIRTAQDLKTIIAQDKIPSFLRS